MRFVLGAARAVISALIVIFAVIGFVPIMASQRLIRTQKNLTRKIERLPKRGVGGFWE